MPHFKKSNYITHTFVGRTNFKNYGRNCHPVVHEAGLPERKLVLGSNINNGCYSRKAERLDPNLTPTAFYPTLSVGK